MSLIQGLKLAGTVTALWLTLAPSWARAEEAAIPSPQPIPTSPLFADIPAPDDSWIPKDRRDNSRSWKRGYAQAVSGEYDSVGLMKDRRACSSDAGLAHIDPDCLAGFKRGAQEIFNAIEGQSDPNSPPCSFKFKRGASAQTLARCECLIDFRAGIKAAARVCISQLKHRISPLVDSFSSFLEGLSVPNARKYGSRPGKSFMAKHCTSRRSCGEGGECPKDLLEFQQVEVSYLGCFSAGFSQTHEVCSVVGIVPPQFQCLDESFKQLDAEMQMPLVKDGEGSPAEPAKSQ